MNKFVKLIAYTTALCLGTIIGLNAHRLIGPIIAQSPPQTNWHIHYENVTTGDKGDLNQPQSQRPIAKDELDISSGKHYIYVRVGKDTVLRVPPNTTISIEPVQ